METKRLRLEGATLTALQARVLAEHGDGARIIAAEQVTVGGIGGYFAKRHVEVTVEVPVTAPVEVPEVPAAPAVPVEVPVPRRRGAHLRDERTVRLGIAALLDEADDAEARLQGGGSALPITALPTALPTTGPTTSVLGARAPAAAEQANAVSTATPDFARLMDELTFATSKARVVPAAPTAVPDVGARPALTPGAPALLTGPGDLVLLVGWQADVLEMVSLLATGPGAPMGDSSAWITDRRTALAARAKGVEQGRSVLVACPLSETGFSTPLAPLNADQVWVVVHAGRKPADTARWVRDTGLLVPIDAVMVLGIESTDTPGTVGELGLPIGWLAPPASAGPKNMIAIG